MILARPETDERRWAQATLLMITSVLLLLAFFTAV